jgi:hypothetical protein
MIKKAAGDDKEYEENPINKIAEIMHFRNLESSTMESAIYSLTGVMPTLDEEIGREETNIIHKVFYRQQAQADEQFGRNFLAMQRALGKKAEELGLTFQDLSIIGNFNPQKVNSSKKERRVFNDLKKRGVIGTHNLPDYGKATMTIGHIASINYLSKNRLGKKALVNKTVKDKAGNTSGGVVLDMQRKTAVPNAYSDADIGAIIDYFNSE